MTQETMEQIAAQYLKIDTLATQNWDRLDFHEVAVWELRAALQAAYEAGRKAAASASDNAADAPDKGTSGAGGKRTRKTPRK